MVALTGRHDLADGRSRPQSLEDLTAPIAAGDEKEAVAGITKQLGQGEVIALVRDRSGAHRDAEAGARRIGAGDRYDEGCLAPGEVCRVGHRPLREAAVVARNRMQVAGPRAAQGEPGRSPAG